MNKLFIFQKSSLANYKSELEEGYRQCRILSRRITLDDVFIDKLIAGRIDVVVSNGLSREWYYILRGLNIVTITIDDIDKYVDFADIVIDYKSSNNIRYFTGPDCAIRQNGGLPFKGIVNLISKLKWDSNFWGYPVAYLSCCHLTENIVFRMEKVIKRERIKLIEYLCNCHDSRSVVLAEKNGFHFTDIRLSFEKELGRIIPSNIHKSFTLSKAGACDIPHLRRMSENLYKDSRYFFDQGFERARVIEFYKGWVEKAVKGTFDDVCYCLYNKAIPVGFCTVKHGVEGKASIGLFGIAKKFQGRGLAKIFLNNVLNQLTAEGLQKVSVVTQGRNYLAQRLYQGVGFLTKTTELWYHKWF